MSGSADGGAGSPEDLGQTGPESGAALTQVMDTAQVTCAPLASDAHMSCVHHECKRSFQATRRLG